MSIYGALMVQGTTSDAGKSTIVAGLGRLLQRKGIHVAPFKPQNMALNSAVTVDGGEIGRAQALQAIACRVEASTDMNPVLLKPTNDQGAQVIIHGKALSNMGAKDYHQYKSVAWEVVAESYGRLREQYHCVLVEGAGSPAEINLRDRDIANMGFAERVDCPVILVADIDRGGVFAHLVGTLDLLSESEQKRVVGFIINRFRGDIALLQSGLDWLEARTGKPVLGVLPYLHGLHLDAEDSLNMTTSVINQQEDKLKVIVPVLPRISNHTDFDPLRLHPQVDFEYVQIDQPIPSADLIILPGSKNVIEDLQAIQARGWDQAIKKHLRYGGKLIGICGGFQMLGTQIEDPLGIESACLSSPALGLLDFKTSLQAHKQLQQTTATLFLPNGITCDVKGYEIHAGISEGPALDKPLLHHVQHSAKSSPKLPQTDGVISDDQQILGTYLHGLFDNADALCQLLQWAGIKQATTLDYDALREASIDRLADSLESSLDMDRLLAYIR